MMAGGRDGGGVATVAAIGVVRVERATAITAFVGTGSHHRRHCGRKKRGILTSLTGLQRKETGLSVRRKINLIFKTSPKKFACEHQQMKITKVLDFKWISKCFALKFYGSKLF